MLSLIIPTYNERDNVFVIAKRVREVLKAEDYELIFVDDSTDDTPKQLEKLAILDSHVRYEHRTTEKGLGTAVARGFQLAYGEIIAVMDADLQHPPEVLPLMLREIRNGADIVVPSRFIPGGSTGGLNVWRKFVSTVARYMARLALKSLRPVTDCGANLFMFKRHIIEDVQLKPIGWKCLMDVLVRGTYSNLVEIPYHFQPRNAGESKMSKEAIYTYILHILLLIKESAEDRRFYLFSFIGAIGVLINMFIYYSLVSMSLAVTESGFISGMAALCSNFLLNDRFTWNDVSKNRFYVRAFKYVVTSMLGIALNVLALNVLYSLFHVQYLLANLIGISFVVVWNFKVNNKWTYKQPAIVTQSKGVLEAQ